MALSDKYFWQRLSGNTTDSYDYPDEVTDFPLMGFPVLIYSDDAVQSGSGSQYVMFPSPDEGVVVMRYVDTTDPTNPYVLTGLDGGTTSLFTRGAIPSEDYFDIVDAVVSGDGEYAIMTAYFDNSGSVDSVGIRTKERTNVDVLPGHDTRYNDNNIYAGYDCSGLTAYTTYTGKFPYIHYIRGDNPFNDINKFFGPVPEDYLFFYYAPRADELSVALPSSADSLQRAFYFYAEIYYNNWPTTFSGVLAQGIVSRPLSGSQVDPKISNDTITHVLFNSSLDYQLNPEWDRIDTNHFGTGSDKGQGGIILGNTVILTGANRAAISLDGGTNWFTRILAAWDASDISSRTESKISGDGTHAIWAIARSVGSNAVSLSYVFAKRGFGISEERTEEYTYAQLGIPLDQPIASSPIVVARIKSNGEAVMHLLVRGYKASNNRHYCYVYRLQQISPWV